MSPNPAIMQPLTAYDVEFCDNKKSANGSDLLACFNKWVADGTQTMTILHEDGLYRHLRFRKPHTMHHWFDLITWPGNLTITGDMGTYTFARVQDMFDFFTGHINTDYWAEKEKTRTRHELKEHSASEFKQWIVQDFWDTSRDMDAADTKEWWAAIRSEVFDHGSFHDTEHHDGCMEALTDIERATSITKRHYEDVWECDWTNYPWHLEFCMASIVAGIRTYNAVKKAEFLEEAIADPEGQRLAAAAVALAGVTK